MAYFWFGLVLALALVGWLIDRHRLRQAVDAIAFRLHATELQRDAYHLEVDFLRKSLAEATAIGQELASRLADQDSP